MAFDIAVATTIDGARSVQVRPDKTNIHTSYNNELSPAFVA